MSKNLYHKSDVTLCDIEAVDKSYWVIKTKPWLYVYWVVHQVAGPAVRMSSSYYEAIGDRPLFGDVTPRDRVLNIIVGVVTSLLVVITMISAFFFPELPPKALNVYFGICIFLICASHLLLIYWYRMGDLDPKFRNLIFFNAFTIILLCICANLYIHGVWQCCDKVWHSSVCVTWVSRLSPYKATVI